MGGIPWINIGRELARVFEALAPKIIISQKILFKSNEFLILTSMFIKF